MGKITYGKYDQRSCTGLLAKYGGLYIYDIDIDSIYTIDYEYIHFVNEY